MLLLVCLPISLSVCVCLCVTCLFHFTMGLYLIQINGLDWIGLVTGFIFFKSKKLAIIKLMNTRTTRVGPLFAQPTELIV